MSPNEGPSEVRRPGRYVGRALTCLIFALAGFLFYTSAHTSQGTNLRNDDTLLRLSDLIQQRSQQNATADANVAALRAQIDQLARQHSNNPADAARLTALEQAAGLDPLAGAGVTVTLNDAPPNATARIPGVPQPQPDDLVIHQQDLQAVVNALWRGGARGIQVQDQRLISTSAVRCVGNQLILQGRVYSPPYVVKAVGTPTSLITSLNGDSYIQNYLQYVAAYGLGWKLDQSKAMTLPGYSGTVDLQYAKAQ
ncbi:DUF881 domain-containing protein [Streptacidiphilus sp. MAP12-20]|uniref:DUF881 domain-containing protein n=1 Tax=Streptacidiphilus sp. MAP12-20 TaxID=3156299 RepID=UPI003516112E